MDGDRSIQGAAGSRRPAAVRRRYTLLVIRYWLILLGPEEGMKSQAFSKTLNAVFAV